MIELHEIRGSVLLANEVFGLRTPDVHPSWLLRRVKDYEDSGRFEPLSIVEFMDDPTRAERLLDTERSLIELRHNPRNVDIILMRLGIDELREKPLTQYEIGIRFNLTGSRVSAIQNQILRRLRHPLYSKDLRPYLKRAPFENLRKP